MRAIILNNIEDFEVLQSKINAELAKKIDGYNAERWAEPFYSVDKSKIACQVNMTGIRGEATAEIIKDYDVVEISQDDEFWYPKSDIII